MAKGNMVLWQRGHYFYEITERKRPYKTIKIVLDSCDVAVQKLEEFCV
jgi:hypothetical protein